ncbi:hypothetical protein JD969_05735 [Planctomycetota bacterium]|nr:hypothetical protein JD969_05735 [Planctomycetota bacterium]
MNQATNSFKAGQRVVITQQIPRQQENWNTTVEGTVEKYEQRKTGSWFAKAKDDRLWLDRLVVRKDDGEIYVCNLDQFTKVEVKS